MRKLSFTLLFVLLGLFARAQYNLSVSVTSYITAQPMPNYPVYIISDSVGGINYFNPVLVYTDVTGTFYGYLPTMPQGAMYHFETYDSCQGVITTNSQAYDSTVSTAIGLNVCGNNSQLPVDGTVYTANMLPGTDATVYFISQCPDGSGSYILTLMDSTQTSSAGTFHLANYPAMTSGCVLLVKAALNATSPDYANYLPTYYGPGVGSPSWAFAVFVQAGPAAAAVDIYMVPGTNPGGAGFIGGSVLQGANKTTGVGDPLDRRILILKNASGAAVAYTYSDATGHFQFPNLAYGTYKLMGDALGKDNPELTVTLSASNSSVNNILFEENSDEFKGSFTTGTGDLANLKGQLFLFPNPAAEAVSIKGLEKIDGAKSVKLVNMNGSLISSYDFAAGQAVSVPVAALSAGMYMVELSTEAGNATFKFVK